MKATSRMFRWLLVLVLAIATTGVFAQTNTDPTQTVCLGNQPYLVQPNAIPGASYTWSISPGAAGVNWQINPVAGPGNEITVDWLIPGTYTLSVFTTANGCQSPPQNVVVTVNPNLPVSVTIATLDPTTICEGLTVNFTATVVNGGTAPTYQWYNGVTPIAGATNPTYTYTGVAPGASITCQVVSNANCVTGNPAVSNAIDVTVNATLPLSVSIATTDPTTVCEGTAINFTASVTNGGSSPSYQWLLNGNPIAGANSATYIYTGVVPGGTISCQVTAVEPCFTNNPATSNQIAVTVNPIPTTSPIYHN